jgi:hypothetical protein
LPTARATLERALAITKAAYGPDHPQVAITLTNLASARGRLGSEVALLTIGRAIELNPRLNAQGSCVWTAKPTEVPRAFRTVHPLGWAIWKGDFLAPTEEELLAGIQG